MDGTYIHDHIRLDRPWEDCNGFDATNTGTLDTTLIAVYSLQTDRGLTEAGFVTENDMEDWSILHGKHLHRLQHLAHPQEPS